jgi:hypothetical protein
MLGATTCFLTNSAGLKESSVSAPSRWAENNGDGARNGFGKFLCRIDKGAEGEILRSLSLAFSLISTEFLRCCPN